MSNELERRLERALGEAPGPDPGVTDRALQAALEALPSPGDARPDQAPPDRAAPGRMHRGVRLGRRHARGHRGRLPGIGPALRRTAGRRRAPRFAARGAFPPGRSISALLGDRAWSSPADADPDAAPTTAGRVRGQPGAAVRRRRLAARRSRAEIHGRAGRVGPPFDLGGRPWRPSGHRSRSGSPTCFAQPERLEVGDLWGTGTHVHRRSPSRRRSPPPGGGTPRRSRS